MSGIWVLTYDGQTAFRPGEELGGEVSWDLPQPPPMLELRLFWHTTGTGDRESKVVDRAGIDPRGRAKGAQAFSFRLPEGPYSVRGTHLGVAWGLELVTAEGVALGTPPARQELTLSPTGMPITLSALPVLPLRERI